MSEWITATEAGKLMGVTRQRVYQIAHYVPWTSYPIRAMRDGARWLYNVEDCLARKRGLDGVKLVLYRPATPTRSDDVRTMEAR